MIKSYLLKAILIRYTGVFTVGGLIYGAIELMFRGYTHWTMLLAGGVCTVFLYLIANKSHERLWKKWIMGGAVITTVEFVTGIIVNLLLGWNVWSYSGNWCNLFGQICLLFAFLWMLLSVPGIWLMLVISRRIFKDSQKGAQA